MFLVKRKLFYLIKTVGLIKDRWFLFKTKILNLKRIFNENVYVYLKREDTKIWRTQSFVDVLVREIYWNDFIKSWDDIVKCNFQGLVVLLGLIIYKKGIMLTSFYKSLLSLDGFLYFAHWAHLKFL